MLILLGSHGSPGVTTTAFFISYYFSRRPDVEKSLLIEADPTGGTLSAMLPLNQNLGVVSLLTASTQTPNIWEHTQRVSKAGKLGILCGPLAIRGSWDSTEILGLRLEDFTASIGSNVPIVVDGGRALNTSPVFKMASPATTIAVVIREGYLPALPVLNFVKGKGEESGAKTGIITIGKPVWADREYQKSTGLDVFGGIRENPLGFVDLPAMVNRPNRRGVKKHMRSFARLADTLFNITYG